MQWERLKKILNYAYKNCDYYKENWDKSGISPKNIKDENDLLKIPYLTKNDIQKHSDKMISNEFNESNLIKNMTADQQVNPLFSILIRKG